MNQNYGAKMNKENKYLNEEKYKIQIKSVNNKWIDDKPNSSYSKKDAELIMKKTIERGKNKNSIRIIQELNKNNIDILDKIEIEELIRETKSFMEDDELSERALEAAGWGKKSVEKFGKTIGANPEEHGFINKCIIRMKGKQGWDKEKAGGFCAKMVDIAKGSQDWRKGSRKED